MLGPIRHGLWDISGALAQTPIVSDQFWLNPLFTQFIFSAGEKWREVNGFSSAFLQRLSEISAPLLWQLMPELIGGHQPLA